jgi:hypothetical protein
MMSKGHTFSVLNRLGRILGFVWITLTANSFANAQSKLVDDLPTDTRVRIVEPRMHHEVYGTGFVAEIDLSGLPAWTGDLELSAVEWPVAKETLRERFSDIGDRGSKNPFVAFTVALARIGSMAGNSTRDIEPLIPETVFPLSESVVDSGNGKFIFKSLPQDKRVRFLIPHAMVQDSDRVYFMLKADQFKVPAKYFYTSQLFPDNLLPDLKVAFVRSTATRYAGAAGKMITLSYQFPEYLLQLNGEYRGMTPELILNGKYPVPMPSTYPSSWNFVKKSNSELTFFMPDALYGETGKAFVEVSFYKPKSNAPRVGIGRVDLDGKISTNRIQFNISHVQQIAPKVKYFDNSPHQLIVMNGGVIQYQSNGSFKIENRKQTWNWDENPNLTVPFTHGDTLRIRLRAVDSREDVFTHYKISFEVPIPELKTQETKTTIRAVDIGTYSKYVYKMFIEYKFFN